ncbi:transporter associated domain-containing protein [uncultured Cardiobacterium sp.]|uniref:HlyC/CorC family transporter n=1 Tax=uncultured Cardiobacterium sp. TaxID=417619 RepID=UPI002623BD2B|nr:transporter associated domain-containing protein [uncultured Cardiobacterium sp.]
MNEDHQEPKNQSLLSRLTALWNNSEAPENIADAIRDLLQQARAQQQIGEDSAQMIERLLSIDDTRVRDIMVPRGQIILIEEHWTLEHIFAVITESGHSRYPVVDETHEQIRGILLSKDLLPCAFGRPLPATIPEMLRPATIVPESKPLDAMLRDFKTNRNHMALVIDEYGNLSGLVTIEDVIEEIVGEIDDEHDEIAAAPIIANSDGSYQVQALTPIDTFNETFGTDLSDEDADTIGGYIQHILGKMPDIGESADLGGWQAIVSKANRRQLISLHLRPLPPETTTADA